MTMAYKHTAEIMDRAAKAGLPALEGTEKQRAWAEALRSDALRPIWAAFRQIAWAMPECPVRAILEGCLNEYRLVDLGVLADYLDEHEEAQLDISSLRDDVLRQLPPQDVLRWIVWYARQPQATDWINCRAHTWEQLLREKVTV
jgi:hypothetical protein